METQNMEQPALPTITSGQVYNARTPAAGLTIETDDDRDTISTAWKQIGGDINPASYGGMFATVDAGLDEVNGVQVVEVAYMLEDSRDWKESYLSQDGNYLAQNSYVDVDAMDWHHARRLMDSMGWLARQRQETEPVKVPDDVWNRVWACEMRVCERRNLARWQGRKLTQTETEAMAADIAEAETLRAWYSLPRVMRAEAAVRYGGYGDGQDLVFATLAQALDYFGIPASALTDPSHYTDPDPDAPDTDDEQTPDEPDVAPAV